MTGQIINSLHASVLITVFFAITGCMNITTRLAPEDTSVKGVRQAEDCVGIFLGLSYGTVSVEAALAGRVTNVGGFSATEERITKIRRVELQDFQFLFFGNRCVGVIGE